jgi:hypothetical protein
MNVVNLDARRDSATIRCLAKLDLQPDDIEPTAELLED